MAQIEIKKEPAFDGEFWPQICMRCANDATKTVPIPTHYLKKQTALRIPICDRHAHHWQAYDRRNRWGILVILICLLVVMIALWNQFGADRVQNNLGLEQLPAIVVGSGFAIVLLGLVLLIWIGPRPIRVEEATENGLTLSGVSKEFAKLWQRSREKSEELPPLDPRAKMETHPYRRKAVCPYPAIVHLSLISMLASSLLGLILGLSAKQLSELAANWPADDVRHLPIIGGVLFAYGIVVLSISFQSLFLRLWLRFGFGMVVIVLMLTGCAGLLNWAKFLSARFLVAAALNFPAFMMLFFFINVVEKYRLRHATIAGFFGFLVPIICAATAVLAAGSREWPLDVAFWLAPVFAFMNGLAAAEQAKKPYCTQCDNWLSKRPLGALGRPLSIVEPIVGYGEIIRLASEPMQQTADAGDVSLTAYACDHCREKAPIILELLSVSKDGKRTTEKRAGRWVYPGVTLRILEEILPQSKEGIEFNGESTD